jgi:hypothetical protein
LRSAGTVVISVHYKIAKTLLKKGTKAPSRFGAEDHTGYWTPSSLVMVVETLRLFIVEVFVKKKIVLLTLATSYT